MSWESTIEALNTFRIHPELYFNRINVVSKALLKAKRKDQSKDLDDLLKLLSNQKGLTKFTISTSLCKATDELLNILINNDREHTSLEKSEFDAVLQKHTSMTKDAIFMTDLGESSQIIPRILISYHDVNKMYKKEILSPEHKYIGASTVKYQDSELSIIILCKDIIEINTVVGLKKEEDCKLKKIFDMFDFYKTGILDAKVMYDSLLHLGYDVKNKTLLNVFGNLKEQNLTEGVTFEIFKNEMKKLTMNVNESKSRADCLKLFHMFVDDSISNTISVVNLIKILEHTDSTINPEDLNIILKKISSNGKELSFEEFYQVMSV